MDINPQTAPVCSSRPLFVVACRDDHRLTAIEFTAGPDDELAYETTDGTLPDACDDEMWAEQGDMIDAYVVVDRYGRRVPGEPVWATAGEYDLQDNRYTQRAIDAALAANQEPEPMDAAETPWRHGPWAPTVH